jgi:CMP-N-acetylneuraminic acid synthetase
MSDENNSDEMWQPLNFDSGYVSRTQDLKPVFVSNGAFFIVTKKSFSAERRRIVPPVKFFELTAIEALEIDYEDDFILANLVSKALA